MKRTVTCLLAVAIVVVPASVSPAKGKRVEGSFTAKAHPLPLGWPVSSEGCMAGVEGVHKVTKRLEIPYSGWLRVEAHFLGDWDLGLYDAEGRWLATSHNQSISDSPVETITYYVRRGQPVGISLCNSASWTEAAVRYYLQPGSPWSAGAGKERDLHEENLRYRAPSLAKNDFPVSCHSGMEIGCPSTTAIRPSDRFVWVNIEDSLERKTDVAAHLYQYSGSTYVAEEDFCTEIPSGRPIELKPGVDLIGVAVLEGPCADGNVAAATQGEIRLIFSNRRS